jgi:hypothetical protein
MALDRDKLERQSGGLQQKFSYQTTDTIATVDTDGYFNSVTSQLRQFDTIEVVSETGGTPKFDTLFVSSATGATTVTTGGLEGLAAD